MGRAGHSELTNRRKDGRLYTEQMSITPIRDGGGKVTQFIATKQDVTGRKSLEAQLHQVAIIEAIGRLAGGVAHDFNNLLTVINGYSEILREKLGADTKSSIYLKEIFDAGQRAASLPRQPLAFSRRRVLAPQVLDLNTVVSNLEKMLRRLIGEDIKLHTILEPSLNRVKARDRNHPGGRRRGRGALSDPHGTDIIWLQGSGNRRGKKRRGDVREA
jgi:signal transduction histidine kinase